jgi:2-methylaconitate cis-trans-isomerase PrpF
LAAAAAIPGTLVHGLARPAEAGEAIRIAHASGVLDVSARGNFRASRPTVSEAIVFRTARKLMEGRVYY